MSSMTVKSSVKPSPQPQNLPSEVPAHYYSPLDALWDFLALAHCTSRCRCYHKSRTQGEVHAMISSVAIVTLTS